MKKIFCLPAFVLRFGIVAPVPTECWRKLRLSAVTFFCILILKSIKTVAQNPPSGGRGATYCNPINIDYGYTPIPNFSEWGRHRATADPVIVTYKGDYYLFSTNQWGYWWSNDMLNWKFISRKFLRPWNKAYD